MDAIQMKYFCTVAEHEHLTKAAEIMNISPPALSLAIRRIEAELGTKLFCKSGRNIKLSKTGKIFYSTAKECLAQFEKGLSLIKREIEEERHTLTVSLISSWIEPELLRQIYKAIPDCRITSFHASKKETFDLLRNNKLDFVVRIGEDIPDLSSTILRMEEMGIVVSKTNKLSTRSSIYLEECAGKPFVCFDIYSESDTFVHQLMRNDSSFTPEIVTSCDSPHTALAHVENSDSLMAYIPKSVYSAYNSEKLHFLSVINKSFLIPLRIYWPKTGPEKPYASIARKQIINYYNSKKFFVIATL